MGRLLLRLCTVMSSLLGPREYFFGEQSSWRQRARHEKCTSLLVLMINALPPRPGRGAKRLPAGRVWVFGQLLESG